MVTNTRVSKFKILPIFALQDFLQAKQAASFYIKIVEFDGTRELLAPISLNNSQTGEKLVITKIAREYTQGIDLTISRFPIGTNAEEWHSGMAQHSNKPNRLSWRDGGQYSEQEYRNIIIDI
jgi:hypothetical protein